MFEKLQTGEKIHDAPLKLLFSIHSVSNSGYKIYLVVDYFFQVKLFDSQTINFWPKQGTVTLWSPLKQFKLYFVNWIAIDSVVTLAALTKQYKDPIVSWVTSQLTLRKSSCICMSKFTLKSKDWHSRSYEGLRKAMVCNWIHHLHGCLQWANWW